MLEGLPFPDLNIYFRAIVIKTVYQHKETWANAEDPHMDTCNSRHFISDKGAKNIN